jgi:hypothetical protein
MGDLCHNFVQWVWTRIVSCWPVQKIFLLMTCPVIITDSFYKNHIQNNSYYYIANPPEADMILYSHFTIPRLWLWSVSQASSKIRPWIPEGVSTQSQMSIFSSCFFLLGFTLRLVFWFSFAVGFIQLHGLSHVRGIDKTMPPNTKDSHQSPPSHEHSLVLYSAWQSPFSM